MLVFLGVLSYISKVQLSDKPIAAGDRVIVTAMRGMTVKVKKERGGV
jgi:membrane protein implicated in regulation of membrane protease activity